MVFPMCSAKPPGPPPRRRAFIPWPRRVLGLIILAAVGYVFFLFQSGRISTFVILGSSMLPTLVPGDHVFVDRRMARPIQRDDLVIFQNPTPGLGEEVLVKRVVALPGDRLEVIAGHLYVNGVREMIGTDGDVVFPVPSDPLPDRLGEGQVLVLGDNRMESQDSTEFGPLAVDAIEGRLTFRYLPLARFGYVN